jgi:hypothetical protein
MEGYRVNWTLKEKALKDLELEIRDKETSKEWYKIQKELNLIGGN